MFGYLYEKLNIILQMTLFLDTVVHHGRYCVCLLNMQGSLPPFLLTNKPNAKG